MDEEAHELQGSFLCEREREWPICEPQTKYLPHEVDVQEAEHLKEQQPVPRVWKDQWAQYNASEWTSLVLDGAKWQFDEHVFTGP